MFDGGQLGMLSITIVKMCLQETRQKKKQTNPFVGRRLQQVSRTSKANDNHHPRQGFDDNVKKPNALFIAFYCFFSPFLSRGQ